MLHPRHDFLADIAAFAEIDAAELIHVGLVRKRIAVAEIDAALRYAERNAMGVVIARRDEIRAELGRRRRGKVRRNHQAKPERRQARIGVAQAVFGDRRRAVPGGEHAERLRQILDHDLGAQFIEVEFFDERCDERPRRIEKEAAAVRRRRFGHEEIGNDFALRRQQRAKARRAGRELEHVGCDEPMQKIPRTVAGHLDDAAVREEGGLHAILVLIGQSLARSCLSPRGRHRKVILGRRFS